MGTKALVDPTQSIHWILDWDGTITRRDTLDALVSISASSKPNSPVLDEWKRVSEAYMSDYTTTMKKLAPEGKLPETLEKERQVLLSLKSVEQASLDRVSSSGIFADLTKALLEEGARDVIGSKKVEIRKGFDEFLRFTQNRGHDGLNLLSVNWSCCFIDACLRAAGTPLQKSSIYANELDGIGSDSASHGHIGPRGGVETSIISSGDKLEYMDQLREKYSESRNAGIDSRTPVVYVGDSWTDIECLLEADLGICIRDQPLGSSQKKLAERLESLGIHCPHLSVLSDADGRQVVWARDFAEIIAWARKHEISKE